MDPVVALLHDLVAIDSVNPSLVAGAAGEARVAARIADACRASGLAVHVQEAAPGRPNVIGVLEGRQPGRTLMLCGHIDTVGVGPGMHAPFTPTVRDGKLYGRGAQDMKAGVAAVIDAARAVADSGGLDRGRLVIAAVVDEEYASIGADALVREWRADAAVVTEPTDMRMAVAHKGFAGIAISTRGVAAHGSRPADGRDAILRMGRVLGALEQLDRALQRGRAHPLLGPASLHASIIEGGREMSTYPDACTLLMERRTIPGEASSQPIDEVRAILAAIAAADPEFSGEAHLRLARDAFEIDPLAELPQLFGRLLAARGWSPEPTGVSFWTDAQILSDAGIPTIVFGPRGAGLHSDEEHVVVDDVITCRDLLATLARQYC